MIFDEQLIMIFPKNSVKSKKKELSDEYFIRNYNKNDQEAYIDLMKKAGFSYWNSAFFNDIIKKVIPDGILLIEHKVTNNLVATALCSHNPRDEFVCGGELGWVAGDPEHKGNNLGSIICYAATQLFIKKGYKNIYLFTDDFRLPAIKIYLELGYIPFYQDNNQKMTERWKNVLENFKKNEKNLFYKKYNN